MPDKETSKELGPFQLALVVLSVVLLVALAVDLITRVPTEISRLIHFIDTLICVLLLTDFSWRLARAPAKLAFLRWGWLDLLAAIPVIDALRYGRIFRIVRVVRLVMALRSSRRLLLQLIHNRQQTGLASAMLLTFLAIAFASIGMLVVERHPDSNIRTAEDALWWAMVTITTIGYGDRYPVTDAGRIIASILMVCGIGLFGTLSGVAASFFLGAREPRGGDSGQGAEDLEKRVARLEQARDDRGAE